MKQEKCSLIILDGWGIGKKDFTDAIYRAQTPFVDSLFNEVPNTTLTTFGNAVGLPNGQMGNSEVGHINIGAGRVVWQQLELINQSFLNKEIEKNIVLNKIVDYCLKNDKPIHLIGLVSNGGVHSNMEHLIELCQLLHQKNLQNIFIHCFTDGRDTDPKSGYEFVKKLNEKTQNTNAKIATISGRYYAMDRDNRWERVAKTYHTLVNGIGEKYTDFHSVFEKNYQNNITDEFILPSVIYQENGMPVANIQENDAVLFFNFRTDRGRELTKALTQHDFPEFEMKKMNLYFTTMTEYDATFNNICVLFPSLEVKNSLGEYISNQNLTQLRAAETEKYPHVTFFFSGGIETEFKGESRILEPSPKVATYDMKPEMSANELTSKVIKFVEQNTPDFVCLNYANTDMVGHTGVWEAIVKAAETVDTNLQKLCEVLKNNGYNIIIIADHGNADEAKNIDGSPNTAHSVNPVPCFVISNQKIEKLKAGKLADVAPTILKLMNLPQPKEMNGESFF